MRGSEKAFEEPDFDLPASGCLEFLLPALPASLVGDQDQQWIRDIAAQLPPIPRMALELRLGRGDKHVDLHQRFCVGGADPRILERYLSRPSAPTWCEPRLHAFLLQWTKDMGEVRGERPPLYLEWDRPKAGSGVRAPGIFLPVEHPGDTCAARARHRATALRHAERIEPAMGPVVAGAIDLLGPLLPRGASLNFIGFMIGRADALRVNIRGIRPPDLEPMLERIGWTGDRERAALLFEQLVGSSDRVIVGLDFAPGLQGRIGFEVVLDRSTMEDRRWAHLFDMLVADGLCDDIERSALKAFPGESYPEKVEQPWPAAWVIASARSPRRFLPWVERRISHLKLAIASDGSVGAKAYVSAEHHCTRERFPSRASSEPPSNDRITTAPERAIAFLVAALGQDDLWRDFSMPGPADEWVTAFVGYSLATLQDERARQAVERSLPALLRRQRDNGGWGYNGNCPPDADSTAWALRFLAAAGYAGSEVDRAKAFLLSHRLESGCFSTYAAGAPMHFDDRAWHGASEGWTQAHLCVTANAMSALGGVGSKSLLAGQAPEGCWPTYWWRNDSFGTALAVEMLSKNGALEAEAAAYRKAARWARARLAETQSAFDRAWLSRILRFGNDTDREDARRLLRTLAAEQEADGGWPSGARLLLPHPSDLDRSDRLIPFPDLRRVFTTASVLIALTQTDQP